MAARPAESELAISHRPQHHPPNLARFVRKRNAFMARAGRVACTVARP
eukprot:CAMPEP_0206502294 /NCGR_PEP_ID=MMETSP0324_2-20121206/53907_1 /ASSEMBLY_ACC=CAM_ASM_000836 /TAXON_ID=2866 /ORGANISM="Crypthecodinium cohnii, Strain Seligo" /LENGTH=47 /DNA_ID= /DNA_START= /DNA_END= /DNA_ORIENTATION=